MPLNAAAISELSIETAALTLWQEFLSGYFNNATHAVGANAAVLFPSVTLRFQQSALPQPLDGVGMSVVWVRPSRIRYAWETVYVGVERQRQQMAYAHCSFMFWVRAELVETGSGNATSKCRDAAQLLFGLLQNSAATRPLAQKGIHRLRPESPQLVSEGGGGGRAGDAAFSTRLLNCSAMIHYPVLSQI